MKKEFVFANMEVKRGGELIDVRVEGYVVYSVDKTYGEDADGNRGVSRTFVEDVEDLEAFDDYLEEEVKLTDKEKEEAESLLVRDFLGE